MKTILLFLTVLTAEVALAQDTVFVCYGQNEETRKLKIDEDGDINFMKLKFEPGTKLRPVINPILYYDLDQGDIAVKGYFQKYTQISSKGIIKETTDTNTLYIEQELLTLNMGRVYLVHTKTVESKTSNLMGRGGSTTSETLRFECVNRLELN